MALADLLVAGLKRVPAEEAQAKQPGQQQEGSAGPKDRSNAYQIHQPPADGQRQQAHRIPADVEQGEDPSADRIGDRALHGELKTTMPVDVLRP